MPEEIKIVVRQESEGDALKKTAADLDALTGKAAEAAQKVSAVGGTRRVSRDPNANLASTGSQPPKKTGAEAARAILQGPAAVAEREAAAEKEATATAAEAKKEAADATRQATAEQKRAARQASDAEREAATEKRKQASLSRRLGGGLLTIGREAATGGGIEGNAAGLLGSAARLPGGPVVKTAGIVAALTALFVGNAEKEEQKDRSQVNEAVAARAANSRAVQANAGGRGTAGGAEKAAFAAEQEAARLREQRPELKRQAEFKLFEPSSWTWGGLRKNAGQRALEENINAEETAKINAEANRKQQVDKFEKEGGAVELGMQAAQSKHNIEGQKELRILQEKLTFINAFNAAQDKGATKAQAQQSGDFVVNEERFERGRTAAAGLINARSGAGDISRAAGIAGSVNSQREDYRPLADRLDILNTTVRQGNATAAVHNWSPPAPL